MCTRSELRTKALNYIETTYKELIAEIKAAMNRAAESGKLCIYQYAVRDEDEARSMARYFRAKGFETDSSWSFHDKETDEFTGWYINVFWW